MEPDPKSAHEEEIFEGVIDAMMRGDVESFVPLNQEWERIDQPVEGKTLIRFAGEPRLLTTMGTCPHCGVSWSTDGIAFGEDEHHGLIQQQMHLFYRCRAKRSCRCWVDDVNGESWERCMRCDNAEPYCICSEGCSYGPCMSVEVVITWEDSVS